MYILPVVTQTFIYYVCKIAQIETAYFTFYLKIPKTKIWNQKNKWGVSMFKKITQSSAYKL